ncbi:MAG: TolC family protein [Gemmatimonadaceae bacterium]
MKAPPSLLALTLRALVVVGVVAPCAASPAGAQPPAAAIAAAGDTISLSLDAAVGRALQAGDEVRLAGAQVDVARAQILGARATGLPQLRLSSTYSHQLENARAQAVGSIFGQSNTYNTGANLSQTLFQGGRVISAARAANRVGEAAELTADEVRRTVTLDVQRAYLTALLADRLVVIQEGNLALASDRLAQVQQLESGGRAARYDVLRARVERANLEPVVIQARNDRDLALLELKRLLNLPLERPLRLTTVLDGDAVAAAVASVSAGAAPAGVVPGPAGGAPLPAAVDERGSVRAARLTAEARRYGVRVARADLLPTVSVSATIGYLAFPSGGFFGNVPTRLGRLDPVTCPPGSAPDRVCTEQNGGWFSDRSLQVAVAWPLFDGLRTRANIQSAQAQARIAELQLDQEREEVAVEIARARRQLERAGATYAAQQQTVAEADETYRLAALRFDRGLGTQLEASDAQLLRLTAQTNAARAAVDLYLAAAELARAEGRPIPSLPAADGAPSSSAPPPDASVSTPTPSR